MEKRLNKQAEATRAMNKTLNKFITIMSNIEAAKVVAVFICSSKACSSVKVICGGPVECIGLIGEVEC
jgi:hypothetical protein